MSAATAAAAQPPLPPKLEACIPTPFLLSAAILDPRTEMNAPATRMQCDRFAAVPSEDAFLRYMGADSFKLQPATFPSFLPQGCSDNLKVRGILHPASIGQLDSATDVIRVHRHVLAVAGESEEDKANDSSDSSFKYPFSHAAPVPAHQVFPMSVQLTMRRDDLKELGTRLRADANAQPYRDTVWPNALAFYRPLAVAADDPAAHYTHNVLRDRLDPFFRIGLFGEMENGLSALLLALAKTEGGAPVAVAAAAKRPRRAAAAAAAADDQAGSSSETASDKMRKVVCNYIALVSLQFWTLVRRRWLELDPKQLDRLREHLPPVLFYFHHATDFSQGKATKKHKKKADTAKPARSRKGRGAAAAAAAAVDEEPAEAESTDESMGADEIVSYESLTAAALGENNEGAFTAFLAAVLHCVKQRMGELAESQKPEHTAIAHACKALAMTDEFAKKRCQYYQTNHTNFFTCARFKLHPIRNFAAVINNNLRPGFEVMQLMDEVQCKFFPRSAKDDIKMMLPKPVNDNRIVGEHRYVMPYFWSHLTFAPDQPLVQTEDVLMRIGPASLVEQPVHQACLLRRLAFLLNNDGTKALQEVFQSLGACELHFKGTVRPPVVFTGQQFHDRFIESRLPAVDLPAMRMHKLDAPVLLPPVVSPAALRYCVYLDEEIGRPYIPMLSRDYGSLPTTHESDFACMTKQRFVWLYAAGSQQPDDALRGVIRDTAALQRQQVIRHAPELSNSFNVSVLAKINALQQTAGLDNELCKVDPTDKASDWAFSCGRHRLHKAEKRQLQLIMRIGEGKIEFDPGAMWSLMRKICSSEAQAVATYVFHAHASSARVKLEPGASAAAAAAVPAAAAAAGISESALREIFYDLQRAWQQQRQSDLDAFISSWGPALYASSVKGKRQLGMASPERIVNPYWPAQNEFIDAIDAEWNYCDKPTVTGAVLSKFVLQMLSVDLPMFELVINAEDGHAFNMRSTLEGDASEENTAQLQQFFSRMMASAYERYSWNAKQDPVGFDFLNTKKMHFAKAAPALAGVKFKSCEFRCNAPENSPLLAKFQYFFNTSNRKHCQLFTPFLDMPIAFFMWYYYTHVLRPFIQNIPLLYPDSALIQYKAPRSGPCKWIQSLQPSDATPVLSKTLYTLLGAISKNHVFGELEMAVEHNVVVSDRAEAMLSAMQAVIHTQDSLELEDSQNRRLIEVQADIEQLLARKRKDEKGNKPSSRVLGPVRQRPAVQEAATTMLVNYVIHARAIPASVMQTLFHDLCQASEPGDDIPKFMTEVLLQVHRSLRARQTSTQPLLQHFHRALETWKDSRTGIDIVLTNVKRMVLSLEEIRASMA